MSLTANEILKIISNFKKKPSNSISDNTNKRDIKDVLIEAEKGEVLLTYDSSSDKYPRIYYIRGKKHSEGGTNLDIPEGSFVFSDSNKLKISNKELLDIFDEKKPKTPAEIAKKYLFNDSVADLERGDIYDVFRKNAAINDIDNKVGKLALLGIIQELYKGNDVPSFAVNYFKSKNIDINAVVEDIRNKLSREIDESNNKEGIELSEPPKAQFGYDVFNTGVGNPDNNIYNIDVSNQGVDSVISSSNNITTSGVSIDAQPGYDSNFSWNLNTQGDANNKISNKDTKEDSNDTSKKKTLFDFRGGMSYLNMLRTAAGISRRIQDMQSFYSYNVNNPVNADTRSAPISANDKGDYSVAGTTYGSFRPYEQNTNTNFTTYRNIRGLGFNYPGQPNYFKEGGEPNIANDNIQDSFYDDLSKAYNILIKNGVINPGISFDEFKNKYSNNIKEIYSAYRNVISSNKGTDEQRRNVMNYVLMAGINDIFNKDEKLKWNKFYNTDVGVSNRRFGFVKSLFEINGRDANIDKYEIKEGNKAYEYVKQIQRDANEVFEGFTTKDGKLYRLKVDGMVGQHTGFDIVRDFSGLNNKEEKITKQSESPKQEKPKIDDKEYVNVPDFKYEPIDSPVLSDKLKDEISKKIEELKNRGKLNDSFFVQDVNSITNAFANLATIKKYHPVAFTYDPVIGRPVFYSPERQLQASQQAANISARAASSILPSGVAGSFLSGISGQAADRAADIVSNIHNANVGIANEYNQQLAGIMNQANAMNAAKLEDLYNKSVIANQQYDNAKRQAYEKLVSIYNSALDNMAKKSIINMVHLYGSPYKVDEYGRIVFDENYKANITPTKPEDKVSAFYNFYNNISAMGLSNETKNKMIEEYLKNNPDTYKALGDVNFMREGINKKDGGEIYNKNVKINPLLEKIIKIAIMKKK